MNAQAARSIFILTDTDRVWWAVFDTRAQAEFCRTSLLNTIIEVPMQPLPKE